MLITVGAVAASVTVAPQPLNDDEPLAIAQLARTRAVSPQAARTPEEAAQLAAQAWLEHIAPRRRRL